MGSIIDWVVSLIVDQGSSEGSVIGSFHCQRSIFVCWVARYPDIVTLENENISSNSAYCSSAKLTFEVGAA